jgi:outer membrane protein X
MLTKTSFILLFLGLISNVNGQELNPFKASIELGFPINTESNNLGLFVNVEPQLKLNENFFMGLRFGVSINSQKIEFEDTNKFTINPEFDHGFFSVVPTFNYYWNKGNFYPFIGIGVGPYSMWNKLDVIDLSSKSFAGKDFVIDIKYKLGLLLRAGFETGKFKLGLEYNLVPESNLESPISKTKIGTVNSSYLGLSFGYLIL